jgi:3-oxoadipate enol-lactonase
MKVVLLHALPLNPSMWDAQRAALEGEHEVIAPELYPFGSSMAEWADAILERVDGPFVAIGASMGGYCSGAIAEREPDRVLGVGLVGSRAAADPADRRPARERWIEIAREQGAEGLWQEMRPGLFPEGADPEVVERAHSIAIQQSSDDLARAVAAIRDRKDVTAAVVSGIPLLVIAGAKDTLIPPGDGRTLVERSKNGRFERLDTGHLPNLERSDDVSRILREWLSTL